MTPRLSLVIVSWNRKSDMQILLDSVWAQTHSNVQVVIVDNGSTDGTQEWLRTLTDERIAVHYADTNLGAAVARNIGMSLALDADYIGFLDSDAELIQPDSLATMVNYLEQHRDEYVGVAPAIYADAECTQLWLLGAYMTEDCYYDAVRSLRDTKSPHFLSTCVSVWRAAALFEVGGFDTAYPFGFEDYDLAVRVRRHTGCELAVLPELRAVHHLSSQGRPREYSTLKHQKYIERVTQRHRVLTLGLHRYFAYWLWRVFTRAGWRRCHHLHGLFSRRQRIVLWVVYPLIAMLRLPAYRREVRESTAAGRAMFTRTDCMP